MRALFGHDLFAYLFSAEPEIGQWFQRGMANRNTVTNAAVAESYNFAGMRRVVDVGGGNGSQLAAILQRHPDLCGTLFDLPAVLAQARANLTEAGVIDRCELIGGDFFTEVTAGGDIYLLRWILHDYDDERALQILRNCRAAMSPGGRLLVIEQVMEPEGERASAATAFLDLHMLILLGG
jgi:predicted O-methyltransferase YrrM